MQLSGWPPRPRCRRCWEPQSCHTSRLHLHTNQMQEAQEHTSNGADAVEQERQERSKNHYRQLHPKNLSRLLCFSIGFSELHTKKGFFHVWLHLGKEAARRNPQASPGMASFKKQNRAACFRFVLWLHSTVQCLALRSSEAVDEAIICI